MGKKTKTIIVPTHTGPDKIIAAALLVDAGIASKVRTASMLPHEKWRLMLDEVISIGLNVDYRKIDWRSYTSVVIDEYKIPRTPEIQKMLLLANKNVQHQTEKGSFNDIFNAVYSAQYWEDQHGVQGNQKEFTDEAILTEGVQCVADLIYFSRQRLQRDNDWSIGILQKEVQKAGAKKVPRLVQYLQQITTAGMTIDCDIIELLTARKHLKGEKEAEKLAAKIVRIYALANEVFHQEAFQICRTSTIKKKTRTGARIVAANTSNPVFVNAARIYFKDPSPAVIIQQLSNGHTQIFFSSDVPDKVSDELTTILRAEDLRICKKDEDKLGKEGEQPEIPTWFYVKSPFGSPMLLNASIRVGTESIAPTKISLVQIIDLIQLALDNP